MKKTFLLLIALCQWGCGITLVQTTRYASRLQNYCGLNGVMEYVSGSYLHLKERQVLRVDEYLFSFAETANNLLAEHFGFAPFIIERLGPDELVGFLNGISEVYIGQMTLPERNADKSYPAQCKRGSDEATGEIIESDIVFSSEVFFSPRDKIARAERAGQTNRRSFNVSYRSFAYGRNKKRLSDFDRGSDLKNYKDKIEEETLMTMLHEMGHALGYDHTPNDPENIMFPALKNNRDLSGRQIQAVICSFTQPFRF